MDLQAKLSPHTPNTLAEFLRRLRITMLQMGENECRVVIDGTEHHIVASSVDLMTQEADSTDLNPSGHPALKLDPHPPTTVRHGPN